MRHNFNFFPSLIFFFFQRWIENHPKLFWFLKADISISFGINNSIGKSLFIAFSSPEMEIVLGEFYTRDRDCRRQSGERKKTKDVKVKFNFILKIRIKQLILRHFIGRHWRDVGKRQKKKKETVALMLRDVKQFKWGYLWKKAHQKISIVDAIFRCIEKDKSKAKWKEEKEASRNNTRRRRVRDI